MTKTELMDAIMRGEPLMLVEYRGSMAETIEYRDKRTGRMESMDVARVTVENERGSIALSVNMPQGVKPEQWKCPLVKGQKAVVKLRSLSVEKGLTSARGEIESFEDGSATPSREVVPQTGGKASSAR